MTLRTLCAATGAVCFPAAAALGSIAFSFADPAGGRQLTNTQGAGGDPTTGLISYDSAIPIDFIVDGTDDGLGSQTFSAFLEMDLQIGTAAEIAPGIFQASIVGAFSIFTAGDGDILSGEFNDGNFLTLNSAGVIGGTNTAPLPFQYFPGPVLEDFLGDDKSLGQLAEAVFTLTDITPAARGGLIGPKGVISGFSANASFSGVANVIPTPGAGLLVACGLSGAALRRRRTS